MSHSPSRLAALLAPVLLGACAASGGDAPGADPVAAHVEAARAAAGDDHGALFDRICTQAAEPLGTAPASAASTAAPTATSPPVRPPPGPPARSEWYAEPVRVFDNLLFVGQTRYTAWAVVTSQGIIVIDPLFDYSVEAEVSEGLEKLGLDPESIRFVLVSHAHRDHVGGARFLQDRYGARVVMHPADWDLLERSGGSWPKPVRDVEAEDGFELRLGDTTLRLVHTPGHTPGTLSSLIPLRDGDRQHLGALWGGTAFNFRGGGDDARWYREYADAADGFAGLSRAEGVDVLLSNHPQYDGSTTKLPALERRRAGDPHPYVVGPDRVARFLTVAAECARAGLAGVERSP